jgi:hypothetical protein
VKTHPPGQGMRGQLTARATRGKQERGKQIMANRANALGVGIATAINANSFTFRLMVIVPTRAQASRPLVPQALDVLAAVPVALLLLTLGARRSSTSKHGGPSARPARPLKARSTTSGPTRRSRDFSRAASGATEPAQKATEAREAPAASSPAPEPTNTRATEPEREPAPARDAPRVIYLGPPADERAAEQATGIVSRLADDAEKALGAALDYAADFIAPPPPPTKDRQQRNKRLVCRVAAQVQQRVHLHRRLGGAEMRPRRDRQAKVDRRRIERLSGHEGGCHFEN